MISLSEVAAKAGQPVVAAKKLAHLLRPEQQRKLGGSELKANLTGQERTERFWMHVLITSKDECWPWMGNRTDLQYGLVTVNSKPRIQTCASRLAYILIHSEVPEALFIRHRCDNPPCCNPTHLVKGTQQQNLQDCAERGRLPAAALTAAQVLEMRARFDAGQTNQSELARQFNVSSPTAHFVVRRKTWSWL